MVQVSLTGSFRAAMGGVASVEVEADTIRELFARLLERYPALQDQPGPLLRRSVRAIVASCGRDALSSSPA